MTSQIKQRIDQIQHGEVPEGYKKTKVGIAPSDWKETRFKRMFSRLSRKNEEQNDNVLTISAQYGLISQRDFFNKDIASEDKSNYFLLYNGEFAYNKSYSNGYPFGALKRLEMYDKGIVSPLYICFSANEDNECPDFYVHYFEAGMMNSEIQAFAQEGARNHGLLNISANDFFNSYLLMPPLPEQKKIAEILSAQDKLIALKEKLIEEKKRQKKYLMQQLLTQTCCNMTTLSKVSKITMGQSPDSSSYNDGGVGIPLLQGNADINKRLPNPRMYTSAPTKMCYKGDILLSVRAPVGTVARSNIEACIGRGICAINAGKLTDYIYQYLLFHEDKWGRISQGSTFESISGDDIAKVEIPLYNNYKEIQTILFAADCELDLLKRDLDQEKQNKKALMQLLLSGVVRVNV